MTRSTLFLPPLSGLGDFVSVVQGLRPDFIGTSPLATFCRTFGARSMFPLSSQAHPTLPRCGTDLISPEFSRIHAIAWLS